MKDITLRILTNWNMMRVLRLALGFFILIEGITASSLLSISLGSVLTLSGIFNVGGCAGGDCAAGNCTTDKGEKKEA